MLSRSGAITGGNLSMSPIPDGIALLSPKMRVARPTVARRSCRWHDPKPGQAPSGKFIGFRPPYLGRSQARTPGAW